MEVPWIEVFVTALHTPYYKKSVLTVAALFKIKLIIFIILAFLLCNLTTNIFVELNGSSFRGTVHKYC
jgi:hypothetical protein